MQRHRKSIGPLALGVTAAAAAYVAVLRPRQLRWGATRSELESALPGDDVLPRASLTATRAISVAATVDDVWPWVAQMGQGRGGLYSYDWLENLVGCQMNSADHIVAEWQRVAPADEFRLHPDVALQVAAVDPPTALVLRGGIGLSGRTSASDPGAPYDFTWSFVLVPDGPGRSRLIIRERYLYLRAWAAALVEPVSVVSFLMTERMLRGIRDRAEERGGSE